MASRRKAVPKLIERQLYKEAGNSCVYCPEEKLGTLQIHHIIPYAENPEHDPKHMVVLCANCHAMAERGEISRKWLYKAKHKSQARTKKQGAREPTPQNVTGDRNIVAGGDININRGSRRRNRAPAPIIPGTVGTDTRMVNFLKRLAERYNEFKKWEVESRAGKMNYPLIYVNYKRKLGYDFRDTPLESFEDGVAYLQERIANTRIGRKMKKEGKRLHKSFEEFGITDKSVD